MSATVRTALVRSYRLPARRCHQGVRAFTTASVQRKDSPPPNIPPGEFARTDDSITVEYPGENQLPPGKPVILKGKGGKHYRRTLGKFSLEGKTALITGAARG